MRPLFAYLRAVVVPTGVYAASEDWGAEGLAERIERAAGELAALLGIGGPAFASASAPVPGPAPVPLPAARGVSPCGSVGSMWSRSRNSLPRCGPSRRGLVASGRAEWPGGWLSGAGAGAGRWGAQFPAPLAGGFGGAGNRALSRHSPRRWIRDASAASQGRQGSWPRQAGPVQGPAVLVPSLLSWGWGRPGSTRRSLRIRRRAQPAVRARVRAQERRGRVDLRLGEQRLVARHDRLGVVAVGSRPGPPRPSPGAAARP